jgi:endonuclease YncB( thermonuclease family)
VDIRVFAPALMLLVPLSAAAQGRPDCGPATGLPDAVRVSAVSDGRSFALADGREIRLAGIDVPLTARAGQSSAPEALDARAALDRLIAGRDIVVEAAGAHPDRYGRTAAYAYRKGDALPLQAALLAEGWAKVSGHPGRCRDEFLAAESRARTAALGLWRIPGHRLQAAETGGAIAAGRGKFAVAEGKVLSVRRSGSTIYVNFGQRWRDSLTVTISAPRERIFASAGLEPRSLEGRVVRIRGHVEERNGPVIEALRPEQIEVVGR